MELERQAHALTLMRRLRVAGLVLLGQIAGCMCAVVVLSVVGLASQVLPFLRSPSVGLILLVITMVVGPVLGSWALVHRSITHLTALVVCIVSYCVATVMFAWLVRSTDGSQHAFGAMLLPMLGLVPFASIVGSFMGSYVQPRPKSRAG